nr:hypothetical protein [Ensifer sesbaniae]
MILRHKERAFEAAGQSREQRARDYCLGVVSFRGVDPNQILRYRLRYFPKLFRQNVDDLGFVGGGSATFDPMIDADAFHDRFRAGRSALRATT